MCVYVTNPKAIRPLPLRHLSRAKRATRLFHSENLLGKREGNAWAASEKRSQSALAAWNLRGKIFKIESKSRCFASKRSEKKNFSHLCFDSEQKTFVNERTLSNLSKLRQLFIAIIKVSRQTKRRKNFPLTPARNLDTRLITFNSLICPHNFVDPKACRKTPTKLFELLGVVAIHIQMSPSFRLLLDYDRANFPKRATALKVHQYCTRLHQAPDHEMRGEFFRKALIAPNGE